MALPTLNSPQDIASTQQVTQEVLVKEYEICTIEQDTLVLEVAHRTRSTRDCTRSSRASHRASTCVDSTS